MENFSCRVVEVEAMHSLPPPTCAYSIHSLTCICTHTWRELWLSIPQQAASSLTLAWFVTST